MNNITIGLIISGAFCLCLLISYKTGYYNGVNDTLNKQMAKTIISQNKTQQTIIDNINNSDKIIESVNKQIAQQTTVHKKQKEVIKYIVQTKQICNINNNLIKLINKGWLNE